jgi:hypothetical protein
MLAGRAAKYIGSVQWNMCPEISKNRKLSHQFNRTVSPDIGSYFRFWKIKLVLFAGQLMVSTFFYFVVMVILKN